MDTNQRSMNYARQKNTIICEGHDVQSVNIFLKGKAEIYMSPIETDGSKSESEILDKSFKLFDLGQNTFLGVNDILLLGKYNFSCCASEESNIYSFPVSNKPQLDALISSNKDYGAFMAASVSILINNTYSSLLRISEFTKNLAVLTDNLAMYLWYYKINQAASYTPNGAFFTTAHDYYQKLQEAAFTFPSNFAKDYFEQDHSDLMETDYVFSGDVDISRVEYFKHLMNVPSDTCKNFFTSDRVITEYYIHDASNCLYDLQNSIKSVLGELNSRLNILYSDSEDCIFTEYVKTAFAIMKSGADSSVLINVIGYISSRIKAIVSNLEKEYIHSVNIDLERVDSMFEQLISFKELPVSGSSNNIEVSDNIGEGINQELSNSAQKIVEYSEISKKQADQFLENLRTYSRVKGHSTQDPNIRKLISDITSDFFIIYERVFKKVYEQKNNSRLLDMFLRYGYMDEKLLSMENIAEIYRLSVLSENKRNTNVYDMKDWLTEIYEMRKDPSINEFGQDYNDVFREMKKRGEVTDKDKNDYDNNIDRRLNHEISNLFRINQKVCHGQISSYFPVLNDEMITRDLGKAMVTSDTIQACIKKITDIDFSAFYREVSFRSAEKSIEKEFIMKPALPDIILMPTFGCRAAMWQELTGRDRSTSGRFVIPTFTTENIYDLVLKLIGNFRWELCRTMMGAAWNDVSESSLTSDYTDYIQFYKKNKDLSDEAKEKLATQIQKNRNMTREIFTSDYETWINFESKGVLRLNKVSRAILMKHCPFSKAIRTQLEKQPAYSSIITQFNNLRAKHSKSLEGHYSKLSKSGIVLDPELEHNLIFYRDM